MLNSRWNTMISWISIFTLQLKRLKTIENFKRWNKLKLSEWIIKEIPRNKNRWQLIIRTWCKTFSCSRFQMYKIIRLATHSWVNKNNSMKTQCNIKWWTIETLIWIMEQLQSMTKINSRFKMKRIRWIVKAKAKDRLQER